MTRNPEVKKSKAKPAAKKGGKGKGQKRKKATVVVPKMTNVMKPQGTNSRNGKWHCAGNRQFPWMKV